MTLQQLRYLIAIAETGSINAAAQSMFTAQSNVSSAIRSLERELHMTMLTRSHHGAELTNEGIELLGYARQVVEQADLITERFAPTDRPAERLAISTQHYAFSVQSFAQVLRRHMDRSFDFNNMRETTTFEIIEDVKSFRSDAGILYLDDFNRRVLTQVFDAAHLAFHPLFEARVHVFLREGHPLAERETVGITDLEPYPRCSFEQGAMNSFCFSEEPFGYLPCKQNIRVTDRGTYSAMLQLSDAYALSTGVLSREMLSGVRSVPLEGNATMRVGYIVREDRKPSSLAEEYLDEVRRTIATSAEGDLRLF